MSHSSLSTIATASILGAIAGFVADLGLIAAYVFFMATAQPIYAIAIACMWMAVGTQRIWHRAR